MLDDGQTGLACLAIQTEENEAAPAAEEFRGQLRRTFGVEFALLDGANGELLRPAAEQPARDWDRLAELCRAVSAGGQCRLILDDDPLLTMAVPWQVGRDREVVAAAMFLGRRLEVGEELVEQSRRLGLEPVNALQWARRQQPWPADALERLGNLTLENIRSRQRIDALQHEAESLSVNLSSTYEEISLLYRLTQNLKLSKSEETLGRIAVEWLRETVPAQALALYLRPSEIKGSTLAGRGRARLISSGECPVDLDEFAALTARLDDGQWHRPIVVNRPKTDQPDWPNPKVRQLIAVALVEGTNVFGHLAAFNHLDGGEFGTVEASLLSSVAAILGIHCGNIELYRQQSDLLAGVVRALSSAIDAKDPYTCGHSDRVARVAVRLAEELHCDADTMNTIYLAGLLHDVGKIGVDDTVLRKPSKLSDDEYQHIKQHAEIGHRILQDLAKLEGILPVVLHHHESWDGSGYPHHLSNEEIPLPARTVAGADAFDAMTSDRPYRKGMPDDKVDQILRNGSGRQWDPAVIEAFFRSREEIAKICRQTEQPTDAELQPA